MVFELGAEPISVTQIERSKDKQIESEVPVTEGGEDEKKWTIRCERAGASSQTEGFEQRQHVEGQPFQGNHLHMSQEMSEMKGEKVKTMPARKAMR